MQSCTHEYYIYQGDAALFHCRITSRKEFFFEHTSIISIGKLFEMKELNVQKIQPCPETIGIQLRQLSSS
jgi:hypothetical protein